MAHTPAKQPDALTVPAASSELIGLRRGVTLLIDGMALQAPALDPEAGERFQRKMFECQRVTREARRVDQILPVLEALGVSLSDSVTDSQTRSAEMRRHHTAIIALMNEELTRHGIPPKVLESFKQLEAEIKCANTAADLELVRQNLQSALRRSAAGSSTSEEAEDTAGRWDAAGSPAGLLGPSPAVEYLRQIFGTGPHYYIVLVKLPILRAIERLYGSETSGEYIKSAAKYLLEASAPGDRLFHWRHDVVMNVTRREISAASIRQQMARKTGARQDELIEVNDRRIVVANPMSFELYSLSRYATLDELLAAFEPFLIGKI